MSNEGTKEYIGSPVGTILVKAKRKKKGMSINATGKPMELLQVTAVILETIQQQTGASKQDVVGALLEIVYQEEV